MLELGKLPKFYVSSQSPIVLKAGLSLQVSTVIMHQEFQQDYDIRDCAAIKVSTILENRHEK